MPVYRQNLDDVVGVVFRRDLEPYLETHGRISVWNDCFIRGCVHSGQRTTRLSSETNANHQNPFGMCR